MKINFNTSPSIRGFKKPLYTDRRSFLNKQTLENDVFIKNKNTISFGSNNHNDYKEFDDTFDFITVLLDKSIDDLKHKTNLKFAFAFCFTVIDNLFKDTNLSAFQSPQKITSVIQETGDIDESQKQYIDKILKNSGIDSIPKLRQIIRECMLSTDNETIPLNLDDLAKAYGKLRPENKQELHNFSSLILEEQKNSEIFKLENDINLYVDFLKKLGFKNEDEFFDKFSFLKEDFNDFEESEDKAEAFHFVFNSAKTILLSINEIFKNNPTLNKKDIYKVYSDFSDIATYLYYENTKDWQKRFEEFLLQNNEQKITTKTANIIDGFFGFSTTKEKYNFYDFLKKEDLSVKEINKLASSTRISDTTFYGLIFYRDAIIQGIMSLKGIDRQQAKEFYLNYCEVLNAIFDKDNETDSYERLNTVIKAIDDFNIKDDNDFIKLLSKGQSSKKSSKKQEKITKNKIINLVYVLSFATDEIKEKYKSNKNFPFIHVLYERKEKFEKLKPYIEKEIAKRESSMSSQDALSIFIQYGDLLTPSSLGEFFNQFSIAENKEEESEKFNEFLQYFQDKKTLKNFLSKNNIRLTGKSKISQIYCNDCLKILHALTKDKNSEETYAWTNKLLGSNFIKNSKASLSGLIEGRNDEELKTLFETILDKKVKSTSQLEDFFKHYCSDKAGAKRVFNHLKNQKHNFEDYSNILSNVQAAFENACIPIEINDNNIELFDNIDDFEPNNKFSNESVVMLANKLSNAKEGANFICNLKQPFNKNHYSFSPARVAKEIVSKSHPKTESYANILRELRIQQNTNIDSESFLSIVTERLETNKKFINFINSDDWINFSNDPKKSPSIRMHAKMRAIERFALKEKGSIKTLYSKETEQKLKNLFKIIYTTSPIKVEKSSNGDSRFVASYKLEDNTVIQAVFAKTGEMITVFEE